MFNPTRRNRNIGTDKAGFKLQSKFTDAPWTFRKPYLNSEKVEIGVHGRPLTIFIDELKPGYIHTCSVSDIACVMNRLPKDDVDGLPYIHLRQFTTKKEQFHPVWGQIQYWSGPDCWPIVTLASILCPFVMSFPNSLSPFGQNRLDITKQFCDAYEHTKREHVLTFHKESLRRLQLFWTLPHEVGHWVDYKNGKNDLPDRQKEERADEYARNFYWKEYINTNKEVKCTS